MCLLRTREWMISKALERSQRALCYFTPFEHSYFLPKMQVLECNFYFSLNVFGLDMCYYRNLLLSCNGSVVVTFIKRFNSYV